MCLPVSFPRLPGLRPLLAASLTLLASGGLFAQNVDQSSGQSQQSNQNDVSALKTQMQKMQKEYEDRITAMEAEMKSLESKADSGSILNTRILTDADGKEVSAAPTLDESFLKSLTRNFTFSAYVRAGFQFNGNGGGGNFSFDSPMAPGGRERLGNENDTYFELTWMQAHMLGDSPDVMDVSMTFTPAIRYVQSRSTFTGNTGGIENSGNDFAFVMRQAFLEMKNVFKGAPEITFWGGQRFYDRFNTDPDDYFWLDTSGYGAGVYNIDVGLGKLAFAWLGGLNDSFISPNIGTLFKHTFDLRLKNISLGPIPGTLTLVLIGNAEKGGTFNQTYNGSGAIVPITDADGENIALRSKSAWGIGGGAIYNVQFGPGGGNNSFTAYALFGRGATNFGAGDDFGSINAAASLANFRAEARDSAGSPDDSSRGNTFTTDAINHSFVYRAGFQAYFALPWYHAQPAPAPGMSKDGKAVAAPGPAPAPSQPLFSVGLWANWNESYNGSAVGGSTGPGIGNGGNVVAPGANVVSKIITGHTHWVDFGTRPAFWITDNIAIQGDAAGVYESNDTAASGYPGFGKPGWLGVFSLGPVIKPKGGYFTRPELRFYATYAIWSDSLKGLTTPAQENGASDFMPPYNGNTNHGWLFGTQVEWYF
jgi:maltoporin